MWAAYNGHEAMVEMLLAAGANTDMQNKVRLHTSIHQLIIHVITHNISITVSIYTKKILQNVL